MSKTHLLLKRATRAALLVLLLSVAGLTKSLAQDYHWDVCTMCYPNVMAITGVIQINGVEQQTTDLEIGAFCGDVCRGRERLTGDYYSMLSHYFVFFFVYGDNGDQITFRLYDHALGEELDLVCSPMTFAVNGSCGSVVDPYVFDFLTVQTQHTITVTANTPQGGQVAGGGAYFYGDDITVTATANEGYTFINWTENGEVVSTEAIYSFTVTGNRNLVANFSLQGNSIPGVLGGLFSVGDNQQVQFSQGNLQYIGSVATPYWKFADNQWDYIGSAQDGGSQNVDRDLFGFSSNGVNHGAVSYQPWSTSTSNSDYYAYGSETYNLFDQTGHADWGYNPIVNGGNQENLWRTPTKEEWLFIFDGRTTASGIRYARAKVNNVNGVILLPDNWNASVYTLSNTNQSSVSYDCNEISGSDWLNILEPAGAVFLPASGYRNGDYTGGLNENGDYWSSSVYSSYSAYIVNFRPSYLDPQFTAGDGRYYGRSARLVRTYVSGTTYHIQVNPEPAEGGTIVGAGNYEEGQTCTLTATANTGYIFINWTENGEVVSTEAVYSFTVTGNRNLVANFTEAVEPSITHWLPNNIDYEENMPVTAVVEIDGVEQQSTTLELGAFSGEECRGSQMAMYFEPTQRYIYQMTVFGEEGDEITFRLYDHATNEELDLVAPEAIVFDAFGYGNLPNPIVLNFRHSYDITTSANPAEGGTVDGGGTYLHGDVCTLTATPNTNYVFVNWTLDGEVVSTEAEYSFEVTGGGDYVARFDLVQTTNFSQGWNWWSTYIEQEGTEGLEALENGLGANGSIVKAQNEGYVSYLEGYGWYGSLERLYNEQSYRVQANAACAVPLQGNLTNPADHPITLNPGWTWMGFPWNQAMSVEAALEGFEPEANDFIKGRNAYTMYYAENGYSMWFGPLNSLEPGQGYVYYSNSGQAKTLTLNTNGGRSAQPNVTASDNLFHPEAGNYADNMTLTAVVDFGGAELRSEDYEVAVFCNGECRGSAKLTYFAPTDSYIAFLTLYGNDGDELEFVLTNGDMTALSGSTLHFATDGRIGTLSEPYPLCFGFTGLDDNAANRVSVYPNPSRDVFNIKGEGIRRIDVFNAFGQVVFSAETSNDTFQVDLSDKATGVYLLRVVTESGVTNQQLIKE